MAILVHEGKGAFKGPAIFGKMDTEIHVPSLKLSFLGAIAEEQWKELNSDSAAELYVILGRDRKLWKKEDGREE